MPDFTYVIERCPDSGIYIGHVPGFPGAHSQGATRDELQANMQDVISMLMEDGAPELDSIFEGIQTITIA